VGIAFDLPWTYRLWRLNPHETEARWTDVDLIIADDSVIIREGLTRLLTEGGHHICATVSRSEPLLAAVAEHSPDAVVLDIRMPPTHTDEGLRAAAALRASYPRLGILLLSQYIVPEYATRLLGDAEAYTGYLLKDRVSSSESLPGASDPLAGER
jgi:DNA-binding NarL/FixJ family response regulator